MTDTQPRSIGEAFAYRVRASADERALHLATDSGRSSRTWTELAEDVYRYVAALETLGVVRGDRVVQWSENRYEWILTDLALQGLGAIHVPLHATLSAAQAAEQIAHSGAKWVVLSHASQAAALRDHAAELTARVRLVGHPTAEPKNGCPVLLAQHAEEADPIVGQKTFEAAASQSTSETIATILYTSGTAGVPKGVVLTQGNLLSNAAAVVSAFGQLSTDVRLSFLPLSHIFARTCDLYTWIVGGAQLALARSRDTVMEDCRCWQPTLLNGVPYFFERVRTQLTELGMADHPDGLRQAFGGRVRACCSGGAALADATFDFFQQRGVPLLQGYGLTETSPVIALSTPSQVRRSAVGRPLAEAEIRMAADGEIFTRGPHVMPGYWQDDAATAAVLQDGWLATGDIGHFDADGFLYITGRKKEMIVTTTGKNVFPAHLEALLCQDPLILQALVVGDQRSSLAALVVPDREALAKAGKTREMAGAWSPTDPTIRELFRDRIAQRLSHLSPHEQVRRFRLLKHAFTLEEGHLTPKLSLRRAAIQRDFRDQIAELYAPEAAPVRPPHGGPA